MANKADLAKAGTMDLTAQDGKAFLQKNLTEWKKPGLLAHFDDSDSAGTPKKKGGAKGKKAAAGKKAAMKKKGTMVATAEEGNDLLDGEDLGDTRQMTKQTKKATSKATTKRATTMAKTTAEAKAIYGDIDTSAGRKRKSTTTAGASLAKVAKTAKKPNKAKPKAKNSPKKTKKSPMKKAGTMVNTAKEGKAFLKRRSKK